MPFFSSKVTVVTEPSAPLSSFVQTMRWFGTTSRYSPKKATGFAGSSPNTRRYLPPGRTSSPHERSVMPIDRGTHHCSNSSGFVHASNTRRAGASKVRVTTTSRSDVRSTVVRFMQASLSLLADIGFVTGLELLDHAVQRFEAGVPDLAVSRDPLHLLFKPAGADLAVAYTADFFGRDEPGLFEHADVFLHAGEGHVELVGEVGDRGVAARELLENAAPGSVRERGEGGVEAGLQMLNHVVQYGGDGRRTQVSC